VFVASSLLMPLIVLVLKFFQPAQVTGQYVAVARGQIGKRRF
jgi:hypothetical protein